MKEKDARDIARSLWSGLHSSATENFISSLLTSALNESPDLRKWLMSKVGMNTRGCKTMHAASNCIFPKCFLTKKNKKTIYPDIMLWNCSSDVDWEKFEDATRMTKTIKAIMPNLRGIYIEVKRESLTEEDKEKYQECAKGVAKANKRIDMPNFRYAVISSHSEAVANQLQKEKGRPKNSKNWQKLIRKKKLVCHITLDAVGKQLKNTQDLYKKYPTAAILTEYLELILHPEAKGRWKYSLDYYQKSKANKRTRRTWIRRDLCWAIVDMARTEGFDTKTNAFTPSTIDGVEEIRFDRSAVSSYLGDDNLAPCVTIDGKPVVSLTDIVKRVGTDDNKKIATCINRSLARLRKNLQSALADNWGQENAYSAHSREKS